MEDRRERANALQRRLKEFAHRCVKVACALPDTSLGKHIRGQLIRCSTSTAANYRACCLAQSLAAFIAKLGIVIEEADESGFWLEFAREEGIVPPGSITDLEQEAAEITSIFCASRLSAERRRSFSPDGEVREPDVPYGSFDPLEFF